MKQSALLLFFSFILVCTNAQGNYKWESDLKPSPEIPKEFADEEAVYMFYHTKRETSFEGTFPFLDIFSNFEIRYRVKINSQKAWDKLTRVVYPNINNDFIRLKYFDVLVWDKDGSMLDLDFRTIKSFERLKEDPEGEKYNENVEVYRMPEVKVGDEIELIQVFEGRFPDNGGSYALFDEYPVLDRVFQVTIPEKVLLEGNQYNDMPIPDFKIKNNKAIYRWTMTNTKAVPEANTTGTIPYLTLPYFIYSLNLDAYRDEFAIKIETWTDYLKQFDADFLTYRIRKRRKLDKFMEEFLQDKQNLSDLEKVYYFNDYINKNIRIVSRDSIEDNELSNGIEYFLLKGKAEGSTCMQFYKYFFDKLGLKYHLAIGKSKFLGPFDPSLPNRGQITSTFYVYEDANGQFFPVGIGNAFAELPSSLLGTNIYMSNLKDKKPSLQKISFPEVDAKSNSQLSKYQVKVDLKNKKMVVKASSIFNGDYSTSFRGGYQAAAKIDTLPKFFKRVLENRFEDATSGSVAVKSSINNFPYTFTVQYDYSFDKRIKKENDVYKINIKDWLDHSIWAVTNAENRQLDFYVPYKGTDKESYFLVFDQKVELTNGDKIKKEIKNEFGSYILTFKQIKPTIIQMESTYKVETLFIKKDEVGKLDELNKAAEKADETELIIKVK